MQIVIDISEDVYKSIQNNDYCGISNPDMYNAIKNGTPLPKGHGRIGDLGEIYIELNEAQIEGTEEYKGLGEAKQIVCDAPTIIEADKESEG